jgi:hypothetical protein
MHTAANAMALIDQERVKMQTVDAEIIGNAIQGILAGADWYSLQCRESIAPRISSTRTIRDSSESSSSIGGGTCIGHYA